MSDMQITPAAPPGEPPPPAPNGVAGPPEPAPFTSHKEQMRLAAERADALIRAERERVGLDNPPESKPDQNQSQPHDQREGEGSATEHPTVQERLPPAPANLDAELRKLREQAEKFDQEARTWRGRYEAEVGRERHAREAAERQLAEIEAERIAAERDAARSRSAEPITASPLTSEEVDTYGADLMGIVGRHAVATTKPLLDAMREGFRAEIDDLREQLGVQRQVTARTEWDKFLDRLTQRIPDWRKIDTEPAFKDWLDGDDPVYGPGARRKAIDAAGTSLDDVRASKVFEQFLSQQGRSGSQGRKPTAPRAPDQPAADRVNPESPAASDNGQPSLMDLAAPGGPAASPSAQTPGGQRIWSLADIQTYYRERSRGGYANRVQEAERMDREIALAQREGRIRA
jgi:hypothetical protein